MKNTILLLIGVIFLASCSSNLSITKRRYNKGFYIAKTHKSKTTLVNKQVASNQNESVIPIETVEVVTSDASNMHQPDEYKTQSNESSIVIKNKVIGSSLKQAVHIQKQLRTDNNKAVGASFQIAKDNLIKVYSKKSNRADTNTILLVILSIFIPCLAVYLYDNKITKWFWITLVLQVLLVTWIVASIIAILHIMGKL